MVKLTLYTAATPNGQRPQILLEELKAAYPDFPEFEYKAIDLSKNTQKEEWFLKINPNGRIPALVATEEGKHDFNVFETVGILYYLTKKFDTKHLFSWPEDGGEGSDNWYQAIQWMSFVQGGVGPMMGQSNHFNRYAPEDIPYGKNRYKQESIRLIDVLDKHLQDRQWMVGDKFSVVDINTLPWLMIHKWSGVPSSEVGPNVKAWMDRVWQREAVQKGMHAPSGHNEFLLKLMDDNFETKYEKEAQEKAEAAKAWISQGNKSQDKSKV